MIAAVTTSGCILYVILVRQFLRIFRLFSFYLLSDFGQGFLTSRWYVSFLLLFLKISLVVIVGLMYVCWNVRNFYKLRFLTVYNVDVAVFVSLNKLKINYVHVRTLIRYCLVLIHKEKLVSEKDNYYQISKQFLKFEVIAFRFDC